MAETASAYEQVLAAAGAAAERLRLTDREDPLPFVENGYSFRLRVRAVGVRESTSGTSTGPSRPVPAFVEFTSPGRRNSPLTAAAGSHVLSAALRGLRGLRGNGVAAASSLRHTTPPPALGRRSRP